MSKGSLAGVDGRIQSRSYENQEGRRILLLKSYVIVFSSLNLKCTTWWPTFTNNNFQDYGQGFGGQQSGQNTSYNNNNSSNSNQSDNPFANANGPIDIVMMIYHSNNERIKKIVKGGS